MLKSVAIHGAVLRARLGLIFIIIILQSTPVFCCVGPFSMGLSFSFLCAHVPSGLRYKKKTQKNFLPPATTRYHPSRGSLGVTKASLGVTSRPHPPRAATGPSPGRHRASLAANPRQSSITEVAVVRKPWLYFINPALPRLPAIRRASNETQCKA